MRVEFEKNPDMNFAMGRDKLNFYGNDKDSYSYSVNLDKKMYDCVQYIYMWKEENGYQVHMCLEEEWETWENWMFVEDNKKEELMSGGRIGDAVIKASFD